jgi:hypothetical protein
MSTIAQPVTAAAEPSFWETFTTKVSEGAEWLGRNIKALGSTLADYAVKVWEYVKPFFEKIGQFIAETWDKAKEFVKEHKEGTAIAVASAIIVGIASIIFYTFCCGSSNAQQNQGGQPGQQTTTTATTTTAAPATVPAQTATV